MVITTFFEFSVNFPKDFLIKLLINILIKLLITFSINILTNIQNEVIMQNKSNSDNSIYKTLRLFKGINDGEWGDLKNCGCLRIGNYDKNELIFHQGDITFETGIVISGSVNIENIDLWGNVSLLSKVSEGHVFAETYAFTGEPLMVDVTASDNSRILFLNLKKLMDKSYSKKSWQSKILNNMLLISMQKNRILSNRIFCTSPKTIRDRLLIYLSNEAKKAGSQEFTISFNRQQLADYLNVERTALSKELGKMRDDRLIEFHKNKFILKDN